MKRIVRLLVQPYNFTSGQENLLNQRELVDSLCRDGADTSIVHVHMAPYTCVHMHTR